MSEIQRTLILIKPDAVQRDLLGEILHRFERKGLKFAGMKFIHLSQAVLEEHYAHHIEKPFFASLKKFMMQTPVLAVVIEGLEAVEEVRKLVGAANPRAADAGPLRADFSMNVPSNLVHASDSVETAKVEIARFFKDKELFAYEKITDCYIFGEGV